MKVAVVHRSVILVRINSKVNLDGAKTGTREQAAEKGRIAVPNTECRVEIHDHLSDPRCRSELVGGAKLI